MKKSTVIGLLLLAFCVACRLWVPVADFYAERCYPFISTVLSWIGGRFPFSLEEIVVLAFIVTFVDILVKAIKHKEGFFKWLWKTAVVVMWLYVWFYMGWGNNYYRTGLYQRNGIQRAHYDADTFKAFLEDYARELNISASLADGYDDEEFQQEVRSFYTEKAASYGYTGLHKWQKVKKPIVNSLFSAELAGVEVALTYEHDNRDLLCHKLRYNTGNLSPRFYISDMFFNKDIIIARDYLIVKRDKNHAYRICGFLGSTVIVRKEDLSGYQQIGLDGKKGEVFRVFPPGMTRITPISHIYYEKELGLHNPHPKKRGPLGLG